jgi:hypothetical protein
VVHQVAVHSVVVQTVELRPVVQPVAWQEAPHPWPTRPTHPQPGVAVVVVARGDPQPTVLMLQPGASEVGLGLAVAAASVVLPSTTAGAAGAHPVCQEAGQGVALVDHLLTLAGLAVGQADHHHRHCSNPTRAARVAVGPVVVVHRATPTTAAGTVAVVDRPSTAGQGDPPSLVALPSLEGPLQTLAAPLPSQVGGLPSNPVAARPCPVVPYAHQVEGQWTTNRGETRAGIPEEEPSTRGASPLASSQASCLASCPFRSVGAEMWV